MNEIVQEGWQVFYETRKARLIGVATAMSMLLSSAAACFAAVSQDEAAKAINKAAILAPGTDVKVRVGGDSVAVSTFRNKNANDKDTKIEALLIAKTIFDMQGNTASSVTTYFYNNMQPTQFRSVSVKTSDVKAFESGSMGQDELLKSLAIRADTIKDPAAMIETKLMMAAGARRDMNIVDKGEEVEISCKMPALSDGEYKLEAFRMASAATGLADQGEKTKRVRVMFFDPAVKGSFKEITIAMANLDSIKKQLDTAFSTLAVTKGEARILAREIEPEAGPLLAERTTLLNRIKGLEDKGVGVAPFIVAYGAIETKAGAGATDEDLQADIKRLGSSLDTQEQNYASAKAFKASKGPGGETKGADGPVISDAGNAKKAKAQGNINRWALGFFPMPEAEVLKNPDQFLAECKAKLEPKIGGKKAEAYEKWPYALMWTGAVLRANDRAAEAVKFEQQARVLVPRSR